MIKVLPFIILLVAIFFDGDQIYLPWNLDSFGETIIWSLRLPRTMTAFMVGGVLSLSGLIYQSLFKNDLASPYTLGMASSASFGACVAIFVAMASWAPLFAIIGCLLNLFIIFSLFKYDQDKKGHVIILTGVILSYLFSSLVILMQVLSSNSELRQMISWILGDLNIVGYEGLTVCSFSALAIILTTFWRGKDLSYISVGDHFARNNNVKVEQRKLLFVLISSFCVALIVSVCGPIGFVGIIVPHFVKKINGARVDKIYFVTFLYGGTFLVICEYLLFMNNVSIG